MLVTPGLIDIHVHFRESAMQQNEYPRHRRAAPVAMVLPLSSPEARGSGRGCRSGRG